MLTPYRIVKYSVQQTSTEVHHDTCKMYLTKGCPLGVSKPFKDQALRLHTSQADENGLWAGACVKLKGYALVLAKKPNRVGSVLLPFMTALDEMVIGWLVASCIRSMILLQGLPVPLPQQRLDVVARSLQLAARFCESLQKRMLASGLVEAICCSVHDVTKLPQPRMQDSLTLANGQYSAL